QPGLVPAKRRACLVARFAEARVDVHADHHGARVGDAAILLAERWRSLKHPVDLRSQVFRKLNRWRLRHHALLLILTTTLRKSIADEEHDERETDQTRTNVDHD